ncbi:THAP domain-containing protein 1 B-like isoform X2 [Sinocyclocheilus grahami]|uniref:THAP domain-containing protein 1 n=1 Tax=Sinocyclocheilus grahami TaxID=75366 RepID=A0A672S553_SINGR|nr:PREDICTED: THAP domain-containing protein 1 B-like isoform X2 [Sinocyclocheilus grahami]
MSCAAVNCTNRHSPGSSTSFHRFPLGDKDRLQQWLVNIRRDHFKPSPSSRICSHHFKDSCFFTNNKGQVCLAKTAVPTIFFISGPFQKQPRRTQVRQRNVESHEFHTYCLKRDDRRKYVEEEVVLDEFVKEEDPDMTETSGTPVIYPTEICVIAVRHDHCYCSWSSNTACSSMEDSSSTTDMQETESPEMLKYNLNSVLRKIKACRKKMKLKNATIRRLKRKLTSLSSIISELKAKDLIETKHMLPSGKASSERI